MIKHVPTFHRRRVRRTLLGRNGQSSLFFNVFLFIWNMWHGRKNLQIHQVLIKYVCFCYQLYPKKNVWIS